MNTTEDVFVPTLKVEEKTTLHLADVRTIMMIQWDMERHAVMDSTGQWWEIEEFPLADRGNLKPGTPIEIWRGHRDTGGQRSAITQVQRKGYTRGWDPTPAATGETP